MLLLLFLRRPLINFLLFLLTALPFRKLIHVLIKCVLLLGRNYKLTARIVACQVALHGTSRTVPFQLLMLLMVSYDIVIHSSNDHAISSLALG